MLYLRAVLMSLLLLVPVTTAFTALTVPTEIQQPGTQPGQVGNLETPDKCDNCHGGYSVAVEPAHNWRGSMMANAGRDPIFWATVAVAEQDFDGVGDLCIRCHSTAGWQAGRSTPTDGSGLAAGDADGVECDFCHKMTNPDRSEHLGVQNSPFLAHNEGNPLVGYYGSGMAVLWGGTDKLGPYANTNAKHKFLQSNFHRSVDFCGTCHDVSNPAVGDLAHNNGAQRPLTGGFSGVPGSPVAGKAAFNNFPYSYGIVERTFSEYKASLLPTTLVSSYSTLPQDLKAGAIQDAYANAIVAGTGGNYADGSPRFFSCQTCHMRPVTGEGCNKNPAVRHDLPLHDMTGGNYWMPQAIKYLNAQGKLRLGGGMTATQLAATEDGIARAITQLNMACSLSVTGNTLKIVNLTGHKLISGYPEGRRMWIRTRWRNAQGELVREDGKYGPITVKLDGVDRTVDSISNLNDPYTRIYEAHYGLTQEWANQLSSLGYPDNMGLGYDRITGEVSYTLGQLRQQAPGTSQESFHFALNNIVIKDNRIPPYGMSYDESVVRNTLPVPATQFGDPGPGGRYNYWDEFTLSPPAGAVSATIEMLYQPTSWEYIQFLYLANKRQNAFLANEGVYLLEAWLNNGMAYPHVMASATWTAPPTPIAINSVTVSPSMVAGGDLVHVSVEATASAGVASVTANGTALTLSGGSWSGDIVADETLGQHTVTVVARDSADNPATDNSKSYKTARILVINNRALAGLSAVAITQNNLFLTIGKVTRIDADTFDLDDRSANPVRVTAPGHGLNTGDIACARGIWTMGEPRVLSCSSAHVKKLK